MSETPKFGLEQPAEGSEDWHVPLNRNFSKLDNNLVLTVAKESDLSNTTASAGQPAFALDTRAFFIGEADGTWTYQGDIVPEQTESTAPDGAIVAEPGNVQDAIDQVHNNGGGKVRLNASMEYIQPSTEWHVRPRVTLDFNGAILKGSGSDNNTDIMHIHPSGQVLNPKIDLFDGRSGYDGGSKYHGNCFYFDSQYGSYFAHGTEVRGGWTNSVQSTGSWVRFELNNSNDLDNFIGFVNFSSVVGEPRGDQFNVSPPSYDTAVTLDSSGGAPDGGGWMNSLRFHGFWRSCNTMIRQTGNGPNNDHIFTGFWQPPNTADYFWHIEPGTFARGTLAEGILWDMHEYDTLWLIDSEFDRGGGNQKTFENAINTRRLHTHKVVNNNPNPQYATDLTTNVTTEF